MKQSELFTKTSKLIPREATALNHKLLTRGGFISQLSSGVFTFLPLGLRVLRKIENIIREEMNNIGGQEILMPALHPKSNWQQTGRWETMDDLYKLKDKNGKEFCLGPTHEEIIVPLVKKYIKSYKDLPFYAYQIQDKFRMELRAKSGLLRGREFIMKDLYSFHLTKEDLDNYYNKVKEAYFKIFNKVGIGKDTFLTFASGGSFSKFSHEFQTLCEAGEDTIYICTKCNVAINKEIINIQKVCPSCGKKNFISKKAIEVGNIFKLNDKFSKPFKLEVVNKDGKNIPVLMGCYGIGLNRLMGTIVEIYHDKQGIIWPKSVSPFDVHLINLDKSLKSSAEKIYYNFKDKGIDVLWDEREESAGIRLKDSDLIGIPLRVIISKKNESLGKIEVKERKAKKSVLLPKNKVVLEIKKML